MASRPPGGASHSENLIDFDDNQPTYYSGAPPPANDHDLLHRYDIDSSDQPPQGRPSVSYDDFVGGGRSTAGLPGGPGAPAAGNTPYLGGTTNNSRAYSQTSDLHNYQRYSDADIPADDDASAQGYYAAGGAYDQASPGMQRGGSKKAHNRNSILSL